MINKKLLLEDTTALSNKWAMGNDQRNLNPQRVSMQDLFSRTSSLDSINTAKARNTLPFPLEKMPEVLGDLYVRADQMKELLKIANQHPSVKVSGVDIKTCIARMNIIKKLVDSVVDILNTVEKE